MGLDVRVKGLDCGGEEHSSIVSFYLRYTVSFYLIFLFLGFISYKWKKIKVKIHGDS